MKKLQKLKLDALSNMLTRDQMKKIVGGYGGGSCNGYGGTCNIPGLPCCPGFPCAVDKFSGELMCGGTN